MTTVRAPGTKMPYKQVVVIQKTSHNYQANLNKPAPPSIPPGDKNG
jgi:hypothetical protein